MRAGFGEALQAELLDVGRDFAAADGVVLPFEVRVDADGVLAEDFLVVFRELEGEDVAVLERADVRARERAGRQHVEHAEERAVGLTAVDRRARDEVDERAQALVQAVEHFVEVRVKRQRLRRTAVGAAVEHRARRAEVDAEVPCELGLALDVRRLLQEERADFDRRRGRAVLRRDDGAEERFREAVEADSIAVLEAALGDFACDVMIRGPRRDVEHVFRELLAVLRGGVLVEEVVFRPAFAAEVRPDFRRRREAVDEEQAAGVAVFFRETVFREAVRARDGETELHDDAVVAVLEREALRDLLRREEREELAADRRHGRELFRREHFHAFDIKRCRAGVLGLDDDHAVGEEFFRAVADGLADGDAADLVALALQAFLRDVVRGDAGPDDELRHADAGALGEFLDHIRRDEQDLAVGRARLRRDELDAGVLGRGLAAFHHLVQAAERADVRAELGRDELIAAARAGRAAERGLLVLAHDGE